MLGSARCNTPDSCLKLYQYVRPQFVDFQFLIRCFTCLQCRRAGITVMYLPVAGRYFSSKNPKHDARRIRARYMQKGLLGCCAVDRHIQQHYVQHYTYPVHQYVVNSNRRKLVWATDEKIIINIHIRTLCITPPQCKYCSLCVALPSLHPSLPHELLATKLDNIYTGSILPYHSAAPFPGYATG